MPPSSLTPQGQYRVTVMAVNSATLLSDSPSPWGAAWYLLQGSLGLTESRLTAPRVWRPHLCNARTSDSQLGSGSDKLLPSAWAPSKKGVLGVGWGGREDQTLKFYCKTPRPACGRMVTPQKRDGHTTQRSALTFPPAAASRTLPSF